MTANALNITAPNAAPLKAGGAKGGVSALSELSAAGKGDGPLAGFEALLAALLPQPSPAVAAPAAATTTIETDATPGPASAEAVATAADETAAALDAAAEAEAAATIIEPNGALAVYLVATPTLPSPTAPKAPTGDALDGEPLRSRLRPFQGFNANLPHPALSGKADEALETDTGLIAEATTEPMPAPTKALEASKSAPPALGRDKPAGAPAAPALQNANPNAQLAQKAEPPREVPPVVASAPTPSDAQVLAAAPAPARTETPPTSPAVARSAKSGKTERAKGANETAEIGDPKAPTAAAKPATANAVTAAAKPASADAEATDGRAQADKVKPDEPETTLAAEIHPTPQSTAPTAHASHAVRGSPETVANLAAQILKKLEGQSTRFDLELDPAGLGKVNVRLEIGAQGALTAAMSFDNPQAAAELRGRAAELQKALEQAGFNLAGGLTFDVAGDRGQQQQPGQPWQDQGEASGRAFRGQAFRAALDTAGDANEAATNGALRLRRGVTAGLDVRI